MPQMKMSNLALEAIKTPGVYSDIAFAGLHLDVGKNKRTWRYKFREGGKQQKQTLGYFPKMGLADARAAAQKIDDRIESGAPVEKVPAKVLRAVDMMTIEDAIDRWRKWKEGTGKRCKSIDKTVKALKSNLKGYLHLKVSHFDAPTIRTIRDKIHKRGPQMATRFLSYLSPVFTYLEKDGGDDDFVNPCRKVLRIAEQNVRDRILSYDELAAIWHACGRLGELTGPGRGIPGRSRANGYAAGPDEVKWPLESYGRIVRFLMVLALRRDEAASLKAERIFNGAWRLNKDETKANRAHMVKLPQMALDQVRGEAKQYVFASPKNGKIQGWTVQKKNIDMLSGVTGWTLHDLRRTVASHMQELGVEYAVIEAILNHSNGAIYQASALEQRKAEAWALWAARLEQIILERPARLSA